MSSIAISASLHSRACSSNHVTKKQQPLARVARSLGTKQATNVVSLNVKGRRSSGMAEQEVVQDKSATQHNDKPENPEKNESKNDGLELEFRGTKFADQHWKNGTWDLNMFVKDGKMDWDGLIVAGIL